MLKVFLRNSHELETVSISGPFSQLHIHYTGHGWKLHRLTDVASAKQTLEVCINDHKCSLTQGLLENTKLAQHVNKEGHNILEWVRSCRFNHTGNTRYPTFLHIIHPTLDIFPGIKQKSRKCNSTEYIAWEISFTLVSFGEFVSAVMTCILIVLWCKASYF
jgi:hypothetical protein